MKRSLSEGLLELLTMPYSTIKQVSQITGIPSYTLRFWEKEFERNLVPSRTKGRRRRYTPSHIPIIKETKKPRKKGMNLEEIKRKLSNSNKAKGDRLNSNRIDLLVINRVANIVQAEVYGIFCAPDFPW